MKLAIIVPVHNEEENILETISKIEDSLANIDYELVVVNDHSLDRTVEIVNGLCSKYSNLRLVDNRLDNGFANALRTGFMNFNAEAVIPIMGDLCDDLSTVPKMLDKLSQGFDIVCGSRYIQGGSRNGGSKIKGALSCFAGWSIHYLLGLPTHDIANAFKMYRKKVIDSIEIKALGFEISMEIPLKGYFQGYKMTEVPTSWKERARGESNFKILKLLPDYIKLYLWAMLQRLR
jgi:dolichol-phosphate mannosyltransferase